MRGSVLPPVPRSWWILLGAVPDQSDFFLLDCQMENTLSGMHVVVE